MKRAKATPGGTSNHTEVHPPEVTEQKGDLLIRDLLQQGIDSVHDMHVVNTDALTHRTKDPEKCLHEVEWEKKEDVYGGLPPAASELLPICCLSGWDAGGGGYGYPERVSHSHGHQVETDLLKDVWICQE